MAESIHDVVGCDIELKKLTRLGKKNEDGTPRPLRVSLSSTKSNCCQKLKSFMILMMRSQKT